MESFERVGEGVYVAAHAISVVGATEIAFVRAQAATAPRKRARLCLHRADDAAVHEMVIALERETYVRPHRHTRKSESFHVIDGEADVVLFDEAGNVERIVPLGGARGGLLYRLDEARFHTLVVRTSDFVIHEVTSGPFVRESGPAAPFAPEESDVAAVRSYMASLRARCDAR